MQQKITELFTALIAIWDAYLFAIGSDISFLVLGFVIVFLFIAMIDARLSRQEKRINYLDSELDLLSLKYKNHDTKINADLIKDQVWEGNLGEERENL